MFRQNDNKEFNKGTKSFSLKTVFLIIYQQIPWKFFTIFTNNQFLSDSLYTGSCVHVITGISNVWVLILLTEI